MEHLSEVLRILDGALRHDAPSALNYAHLLADKLEEEGALRQARAVRATVSRAPATVGAARAAIKTPTDEDSRLDIVQLEHPDSEPPPLVLPRLVEDRLSEYVEGIRRHDALAARGIDSPNRLLLFGPPGTGKTTIAKHVAWKLNLPLITTRSDTLVSSLLGSTSKNIHRVFEYARKNPCVLFLDEFDALAKSRTDTREIGELQRIVIALIQNLDSFPTDCVLIAATNQAEMLDPAIWRRFEVVLRLPLPTAELRGRLWRLSLGEQCPVGKELDTLIRESENLSPATIELVARDVLRLQFTGGDDAPITTGLILRRLARLLWLDRYEVFEDPAAEMAALREWSPTVFTVRTLASLFHVSTRQVMNAIGSPHD